MPNLRFYGFLNFLKNVGALTFVKFDSKGSQNNPACRRGGGGGGGGFGIIRPWGDFLLVE